MHSMSNTMAQAASIKRPFQLGLTGGIGSGKSTVAQRLAERGASLIDADHISRSLTAPGGGEGTAVPDARPQALREIPWLCPDYADERGHLKISVHALLIDAPGLKLVVDTCTGNAKQRTAPLFNQLNTPFLQRFEATGWRREDVQAVLCTHLHVDHVGWNTMWVDGRWVPTFPNARYLIGRAEFAHWTQEPGRDTEALLADSVQPERK